MIYIMLPHSCTHFPQISSPRPHAGDRALSTPTTSLAFTHFGFVIDSWLRRLLQSRLLGPPHFRIEHIPESSDLDLCADSAATRQPERYPIRLDLRSPLTHPPTPPPSAPAYRILLLLTSRSPLLHSVLAVSHYDHHLRTHRNHCFSSRQSASPLASSY